MDEVTESSGSVYKDLGLSAVDEIAAERRRQIEQEGWTSEHDDKHSKGEIAKAAACYAYMAAVPEKARDADSFSSAGSLIVMVRRSWPWNWSWWKPKDRRRDLIRAGALIVAEIERLDRAENK